MVYGISDTKVVSREKIDKTFSDLLEDEEDRTRDLRATSFHLGKLSMGPESYMGKVHEPRKRGGPRKSPRRLRPDKLEKPYHMLSIDKDEPKEGFHAFSAELAELSECPEIANILKEKGSTRILAARAAAGPEKFRLDTGMQRDIEEIVKERWGYLVMQFGGFFLTEVRPNRCFIGNKSLADMLITYGGDRYGINKQLLGNYLGAHSNGKKGKVQVHFSDIMFNPKTKDYDLFSITSGDVKKAGIFLELAEFLREYNKGEEVVIPVHLPYYEKWKTEKVVREFGHLDTDGERDALINANEILKYLDGKLKGVKLALETGSGESERNGKIAYALLYHPFHFQTLIRGRENFVSICEDVGHLNLESAETNWKDYLTEGIAEFHVSGNNGKQDEHVIATPKTLKHYGEIMSFLKFYAGNICAEVGKGRLSDEEFVKGVKNFAYVLFSEPTVRDFENLRNIERYVKITCNGEVNKENFNEQRYESYQKYLSTKAPS